jgi:hypothetical protein
MPSLIGAVGTDIAANYRQQIVPFSRFGTRKVAWYKVGYVDTLNSGSLDMVNFNKIIDAIQTQAEIVMIGAPAIRDNWGKFMIAVFEDTANNGANTELSDEGEVGFNSNSATLQSVLRDVLDDSNLEVSRWYLYGAPGTNFEATEGWDDSGTYQEYDTKVQFMAGYTQQNDC